jgi:ABC-type branched-subunit amino acid transport system substrate-binding protein
MTGPVGSMHASRVNTAFVDSAYGQGLNSAFSSEWTMKTGAGPLSTNQFETPANTDMVVSRLLQDSPDFSVIVADDDASNMMKSLYTLAANGTNRFTDGALGPNFIGTSPIGAVLSRVFGTAPATPATTTPPGLNFTTFRNNYKDQFMGSDPADTSFVANTYDATYVVALTASGVPLGTAVTGSGMAALLMRMSGPGQKINVGPVDFVQGVRTLRQGGIIDFVGSSGELTWDNGTGDPTDSPIEVWGIDTTLSPPAICIMTPVVQKTCP